MQKITPFIWFDRNAEEAVAFYTSVFKDSSAGPLSHYPAGSPGGPAGTVMTASLTLGGVEFVLLNGGPVFKPNMAISFVVNCADQAEVDYYWERLASGGGEHSQCGWLTDRFGVSWQITPVMLMDIINSGDEAKNQRVHSAMLTMTKLVIADLEAAANSVE
jgi:predicted 3-demethylubiquinone-9 3-methyltransferase (glyoxalase superfamily)